MYNYPKDDFDLLNGLMISCVELENEGRIRRRNIPFGNERSSLDNRDIAGKLSNNLWSF